MDPDDPYVHSFEFGMVGMIEIGKERGNQHDMEGVERKAKEVNQKNDLYDAELKLMGHLATIYHIPFIRFVCDEQREENWGANARELCDIITIRERGRDKILMPFFAFEEAAYLLASKITGSYYDKFRFNRGDMTLTMYLLKSIYKKIYDHYHWIENTFGGHFNSVKVEKGTQDEKAGKAKLFVANKKVYANVFATDAWKSLLEERLKRSQTGLDDVPRYRDVYASIDEFRQHRSYFFETIFKMCSGNFVDPETFVDVVNDMRIFFDRSLQMFGLEKAIEIMKEMNLLFSQNLDEKDDVEKIRKKFEKYSEALVKKYKTAAEKEAKAKEKGKPEKKSGKAGKGQEDGKAKAGEREEAGAGRIK